MKGMAKILAIAMLTAGMARATSLTWDGNGAADPNPGGGDGTWDAGVSSNWWDGATNVAWPAVSSGNDDAVFDVSSGTVTVATNGVTVKDLTFATNGYVITNGTLTLDGGTSTVSVAAGCLANIQSAMAGTSGVSKTGTGTLTLSGTNTFTGRMVIGQGTVVAYTLPDAGRTASSLGLGDMIDLWATLIYAGTTASCDRVVNITGFSTIINSGSGPLTLTGGITGTGTGLFRGVQGIVESGLISFTGAVSKTDGGVLTLSNAGNSYTGSTIIANGTLSIDSIAARGVNCAIGAGSTIFFGQTAFNTTGRLQFTGAAGGASDRDLVIYSMPTNANGGVIENAVAGQTLMLSGTVTLGAGAGTKPRLQLTGAGDGVMSGAIAGAGLTLTKSGAGTWTLSGTNTFTDATAIADGTLSIDSIAGRGVNCAIGAGSTISFGQTAANTTGRLRFTGAAGGASDRDLVINSMSSNANGGVIESAVADQTLTLSGNVALGAGAGTNPSLQLTGAGNGVMSGTIAGAGLTLSKSGAGTWTLSGTNTFTGATTLSAGMLRLAGGDNRLPAGTAVNFTGSSVLNIGSTVQTCADVNLSNGVTGTVDGSNGTFNVNGGAAVVIAYGSAAASSGYLNVRNVTAGFSGAAGAITIAHQVGSANANTTGALRLTNATMSAVSILIGKSDYTGGAGSPGYSGTLTIDEGSKLTVGTLTMFSADHQNNAHSATVNLNGGSTLFVKTLTPGATFYANTVNVFNWNDGTIATYGGNDLTINNSIGYGTGGGFTLLGTGLHAFDIAAGRLGTVNQAISGTGSLTKTGSGTLDLASTGNTFSGVLRVKEGTLTAGTINNAGSNGFLGNSANPVVLGDGTGTTGTLRYTGGTATSTKAFSMAAGGTGVIDVTNASAVLTLSGAIDGSGTLRKAGPGRLVLNGSTISGFTGAASVDEGTLLMTGTYTGGGSIAVPAGGTLISASTVGPVSASGVLVPGETVGTLTTIGSLSLDNATVEFQVSGSSAVGGGANDLLSVGGDLALTGTNTFHLVPFTGSLATNYTLIQFDGSVTGDGVLTVSGLPLGFLWTLSTNTADTPHHINLLLTDTSRDLTWIGGSNKLWDVSTSACWTTNGSAAEMFYQADRVAFTDAGATGTPVTLVGTLYPGGVTVNSSSNYTLTGAGTVSGSARLLKQGSGTLTVLTTNNNSGGVVIEGGVVQVGSGGNAGTLGSGTITNNASLVYNLSNAVTVATALTGTGTLAKVGTGTVSLTGANSYSGGTAIKAGVLAFGSNSLGAAGAIAMNGGTLRWNAGNARDVSSRIVLSNATAAVFDTGGNLVAFGSSLGAGTSASLTKTGAGTLTLTQTNGYSGTSTIASGTLTLEAGDNRLPVTGTVNFSGGGVFNLAGVSQTLTNVTVADGVTGTITGSGGALTLTGASFLLAPITGSSTQVLNLTGLSNFTYNNAAGTFRVNGANAYISSSSAALTLSANSTITASSVGVGNFALGGGGSSDNAILNLGTNTVINANTIQLGVYHDSGTIQYLSGTGNPILTLRGSNGVSRVTTMEVGKYSTGELAPGTVDLTSNVSGTSTLDALIGTLYIGYQDRGAYSGNYLAAVGNFIMGAGTLDATSIVMGRIKAGGTTSVATGSATTGTLTVGAGGLVKVGTLMLGDHLVISNSIQTITATFNLNGGAMLNAQSITAGADGNGTVTRTFNWNNGTIRNYAAGTNLSVTLPTMTLAATGLHAFDIDLGCTGTVSAAIGGAGGLTKAGTGRLILTGTNTYTGTTVVSNGTLTVDGSLANADMIITNGAVNGTGTLTCRLRGDVADQIRISAGGAIDLTGLTLNVVMSSPHAAAEYVLVDDRSKASGAFAATNLPPYWSLDTDGTAANPNAIALVFDLAVVTRTWDGGDTVGGGWNAQTNWTGEVMPPEDANLVFPAGAAWLSNTNDAISLAYGLSLDGGYTLAGNALTLGGCVTSSNTNTIGLPLALPAGKVFDVTSGLLSVTGVVSGAGGPVKQGAGTLTMTASNLYTGGSTINAGTLRLTNSTYAAGTGVIRVGNGTLSLPTAASYAFGGVTSLAGTAGFLAAEGASGTYGAGTITVNGTLTVVRRVGGTGNTTFSGVLAGSGTLIVDNTNGGVSPNTTPQGRALFSHGANTFNGTVQVVNGGNFLNNTLNPSYAAVDVAAGSYFTLLSGGDAAAVIGTLTGAGTFTKNASTAIVTLTVGAGNFSGVIAQNLLSGTGTVALRKSGTGTLVLSGTNTYAGVTTIDGGVLAIGGAGKLGSGTYAAAITNNGSLVCGSSANQTWSGMIAGTGALTKSGTGTLTLTGVNTYSGDTVVSNGWLTASGAGRLGVSQSVTVQGGATLDLQIGWAIDDQARLKVESGGKVNVAGGVNETVEELYLGDRLMYQGTWGSSASPAQHQNDTYFTGTGVVTMTALGQPGGGIMILR